MKKDCVIYADKEFILINQRYLPYVPGNRTAQIRVATGHRSVYLANEIWLFNDINNSFNKFKSRFGGDLLKAFLRDAGISLRVDAACLSTAEPTIFRFKEDQDLFLFKLKFGA